MKLALIGCDDATLELARAAVKSGRHQVVLACEAGDAHAELASLSPRTEFRDEWESLLANAPIDAIVLAADGDPLLRADVLRKLTQSAITVLVVHPLEQSMLVYYEIEMIREETGARLVPYLPERLHPGMEQLVALLRDAGRLGRLEQVVLERRLPRRTRREVERWFTRDVELARALAGELTRISALAPGVGDDRYANLGVQLSGPGDAIVRWSVVPAADPGASLRLTVLGTGGQAEFNLAEGGHGRLEFTAHGENGNPSWEDFDYAVAMLDRLAAFDARPLPTRWSDASRAIELTETIERSLEKGRTVEVHQEDFTEQNTFKGTMTSLGCGLLLVGLLVLVMGAVAGGFGLPIFDHWPIALLVVLSIFLLSQSLRLVFPDPPDGVDPHDAH